MEAKSKFSAAEKLIERSSYDYFPRSQLISNLNSKCDIQIETLESKKDISKWVTCNIEESGKEIQSIEKRVYLRMLELLGFFTAIIALIPTAVQNITSTQSVVTAMNASVAKEVLPVICQNTIVLTLVLGAVLVVVFGLLILFVKSEQSKSYGFDTWVVIFIIIFVVFIGILFVFYIHSCV